MSSPDLVSEGGETVFNRMHIALSRENGSALRSNGLTKEMLFQIHRTLVDGLMPDEAVGAYRRVNVFITKSTVTPPHFDNVPKYMDKLLEDYREKATKCGEGTCYLADVVKLMAWFYYCFYRIQPFENGNKRVGRIVCDTIARAYDVAPPLTGYDSRDRMFAAFQEVNSKHNLAPMELFWAEEILTRYGTLPTIGVTHLKREKAKELNKLVRDLRKESKLQFPDERVTDIWVSLGDPAFD